MAAQLAPSTGPAPAPDTTALAAEHPPGEGARTPTNGSTGAADHEPVADGGGPAERPVRLLGRRVVAGTVDVTLIASCTAVIGSTQAERLGAGPLPLPAPTAAGPYLTITLGDTVHRWAGTSLWVTALGGLLTTLIVAVLIPANTGGSSPGLHAVGLRVVRDDGSRAGLGQHLVRTVFAAADLAPWLLPGLVGWVSARRSPREQRLGDRLARTIVAAGRTPSVNPITTDPGAGCPEPAWASAGESEPATLATETRPAAGIQRRESARYPAPSHRAGGDGAAKATQP